MRGKVTVQGDAVNHGGITPAYAGKRITWNLFLNYNRDHPRLCGEKSTPRRQSRRMLGSPPPMRGKGLLPDFSVFSFGITPAYAGKSYCYYAKKTS